MSNIALTYEGWRNKLRSDLEAAEKQASALKATDPADNGKMEVPSYNTEAVRSNMNLPKNPTENTVQDKDGTHGLCTVTKPNGVGEGDYPTAIDGDAKDKAFKTPSTPLSKIAGEVLNPEEESEQPKKEAGVKDSFEIPADIRSDASIMQKLAFCGNLVLGTEQGQRMVAEIMAKEAGRQEAQAILQDVYNDLQKEASAQMEKEAGKMDAILNFLKSQGGKITGAIKNHPKTSIGAAAVGGGTLQGAALASLLGGSSDNADSSAAALADSKPTASSDGTTPGLLDQAGEWLSGTTNIGGVEVPNAVLAAGGALGTGGLAYGIGKMASADEDYYANTHQSWLNALETDFEKRAYMQGAVDAAAADQAMGDPAMAEQMGGAIPADDSQITDEEVMGVIQQMVESGEISPEQVDALMQQVSGDEAPGYTAEQLAAELQQLVESGQVDPATAEQIAAAILEDMQAGNIPSEGAAAAPVDPAMAAPTEADQAMEVQASLKKSASILASLG